MPRKPTGKRSVSAEGAVVVRAKNANGSGSVYVNAQGVWRATYVDHTRCRRVVRGRTQAEALARRAAAIAADEEDARLSARAPSRFTRATTVAELCQWWLDQQRARVRRSSLNKYADRVARITAGLGAVPVVDLRPEQVATWQSSQLDELTSGTVSDLLSTLRAVLREAVALGLVQNNAATVVRAPKVTRRTSIALTPDETRALLDAVTGRRYAGAVTMLFLQGWRVSEVLGLAWQDVDLEHGTAVVRCGAAYVDGVGMMLGPCKNSGAEGLHHLAPTVIELLRKRMVDQRHEREAAGDAWKGTVDYGGQWLDPIWTTEIGELVNRQAIAKAVKAAAEKAGLDPAGISTHTGPSTVVTNAYAEGGASLEDIARHVGHSSTKTTATYVKALGNRPQATAALVFSLLDPTMRNAPLTAGTVKAHDGR